MTSLEKLLPTRPQQNPNASLPYDLLLSIFARASRLDYPTLSLVSKSFRSLLASPELYKARSQFNHTDNCLYVCLWCCPGYHWFTLCRKPNQIPTLTLTNDTSSKKKLSSGYVFATVPIPHSPSNEISSLVAVGYDIYNIGGSISPSSSVSVLDCRYQTWREAPSLRVKLKSCSASLIGRKIYVTGYKDCNPDCLMRKFEVFDTETRIWDVVTNKGMVAYTYTAKDVAARKLDSYCAIENVLFGSISSQSCKNLRWYDIIYKDWVDLKGLVGLPEFTGFNTCVRLANYGGKMAILWDKNSGSDKKIWCAEIALTTDVAWGKIQKIWGNVEWFDHVLTVPITYALDKLLLLLFDETMMIDSLSILFSLLII